MSIWVWLTVAIVTALIIYWALSYKTLDTRSVKVLQGSQESTKVTSSSVALPRSFNEREGAVYSWTSWVLVKNFSTGFGQRRRIFSQGDSPGLYIDSTSNSLIFIINTYGGVPETILIPNISAMKWVHVGLVVDQTSVSIYINGTLHTYHTLTSLPKPSGEPTRFGSPWDGVVGNVEYYPYALTNAEIFMKASEEPPPDLINKSSSGSYFDMTWYTGRL